MSFDKNQLIASGVVFFILIVVLFFATMDMEASYKKTEISEVPTSYSYSESQEDSSEPVAAKPTSVYNKDLYLTAMDNFTDVTLPYKANSDDGYLSQTLFIGDSNTAGLSSFGYMPLQNVLGKPSMGIQGVRSNEFVWFSGYENPVTIVKAVEVLKPRRIVINFGTNNTLGSSVKDFKSTYANALLAIEKAYPYTDIIIAAVLPVGVVRENPKISMTTIDNFNIALAQLCQEQGYRFLNTAEVFKNPENGYMNAKYVATDGVHLNNAGFRLLLDYVSTHPYETVDRRPPRGFVPKRIQAPTSGDVAVSTEIIYDAEPGEVVIFPPAVSSWESQDNSESAAPTPSSESTSSEEIDDSEQETIENNGKNEIIESESIVYDPFL